MFVYHKDTDILFPNRVIPKLKDLRGPEWAELIGQVSSQAEDAPDRLAFSLFMIRQNGCLSCHADSYRAMRGCTICSQQTIGRFKGQDVELLNGYIQASEDIKRYISEGIAPANDTLKKKR